MARNKTYTTECLFEFIEEYVDSLEYPRQIKFSEVTEFIKNEHPEYKRFSSQHFYRNREIIKWRDTYNEELESKYSDTDAIDAIISDLYIDCRELVNRTGEELEFYASQKNLELSKWGKRIRSAQLEARRESATCRRIKKKNKELEEENKRLKLELLRMKEKYKEEKEKCKLHSTNEKKLKAINQQLFDEANANNLYDLGLIKELPPQALESFEEILSFTDIDSIDEYSEGEENRTLLTAAEGNAITMLKRMEDIDETQ